MAQPARRPATYQEERLEVVRLGAGGYRVIETCHGDQVVRAEPFDAVGLPLGALWAR